MEQAIGRLKMKWQFCHRNAFHGDPEFVKHCVMASVALHNFCMDFSVDVEQKELDRFIREEIRPHRNAIVELERGESGAVAEANADILANYVLHKNM